MGNSLCEGKNISQVFFFKKNSTGVRVKDCFNHKRFIIWVKFSKGNKSEKGSSSLLGKQDESQGLLKYQGFPTQSLP